MRETTKWSEFLRDAAKLRAKIRASCNAGMTQADASRKYKISRQRVNQIINDNAAKARLTIAKDVLLKKIPPASSMYCVDCGKKAEEYDHRDYKNIRSVDPVCQPCNKKRGAGKNAESKPIKRYQQKQMIEWAKRREAIRALRTKQWSWTDIGKRYKISPQRAQQLGAQKQ